MPDLALRVERVAFVAHGIVTIAAAVVLAVAPAAIPATVGISLAQDASLLSYFLAAAELAIGLLSIGAARLTDARAIRLIAAAFAVFHGATAVLEVVYTFTQGVSVVLMLNVVVRVFAGAVFTWIALRRRT